MALEIGTTLGPFEITASIGAGGMGEVYRARDTRLGRDVALKTLPSDFAQDAERLARFRREAQVLASLNHPNIAQIHGFEESGGACALVMELIEGPTLADRIEQGPIPIDEALPMARQVVEALEAAHTQGIVHRDLKPANIKVREDGTVKVLDFGLAKALEPTAAPDTPSGSASMSPTITTPAMTRMGMILGTAAYMSPEQAKGRPADRRSDVWAFGVVLYEMVTGRRAFQAEDVSETLAAVLRSDVDLSLLPPALPPVVRAFLMRCLERDPRQRIPDIAAMRLAIDGAFDSVTTAPDFGPSPGTSPPPWRRAMPWAAGLLLAVATGFAVWSLRPAPERPVIRSAYTLPQGQIFRTGSPRNIAMASDGSRFVYNTGTGLFVREMSALDARLIPGTEGGAFNPVFAPDGQSVVFYDEGPPVVGGGELRRISIAGGASVRLAAGTYPLGMSWSRNDGIFYSDGRRILEVPENGGDPTEVSEAEEGYVVLDPQRLPGGDWVLFSMQPDSGASFEALEAQTKIVAASRRSDEIRLIRTGGTSARYVPTGHLLYAEGAVLYAVAFDVGPLQTSGSPVPVVEGVQTSPAGLAQFDVSANGSLIYIPGDRQARMDFVIAVSDRSGSPEPTGTPRGSYDSVRASPDGRRLAIGTVDGDDAVIWIHELGSRNAMRRLTFDGRNRFPMWSPDGERIAFQSDREGAPAIFVRRADGTGGIERLTTPQPGESHVPESWSPDGKHLSFDVVTEAEHALWILTLDGGTVVPFSDRRSRDPFASAFSPDGRWLAYHALPADASPLSESSGVYVEPFPATGARYQAPKVQRDFQPIWSPDGAELIYVPSVSSGRLAVSRVSTASGVTFGTPESHPFALAGNHLSNRHRAFDILPDGRFVGLASPSAAAGREDAAPGIRFVVNWFEELKRLVPRD